MKKTLSGEYSFLNTFKFLIMISVGIYTIFFLINIVKLLNYISNPGITMILITSVLIYILFLVGSVGTIMIINFLFKLDETKNNLDGLNTTSWYENGQKKEEVTYRDGEKDGLWTSWYENGQKSFVGNYKDGLMDGVWTKYYKNGKKEFEGKYKNGDGSDLGKTGISRNGRDGLWTFWYENGNKESEETYKDGKRISSKEWNEDGSPK